MLDLRALVDGTGSTALTTMATSAGSDGTTVAGTPALGNREAWLAYLGWDQLVAGTPFVDLRLLSQDLPDPQNGLVLGVGYPPDHVIIKTMTRYRSGAFQPQFDQTAAARLLATLMWYYPGYGGCVAPPKGAMRVARYDTTFSGALTAGTWGSQVFSPTGIPTGAYAILGATVDAITGRAAVRFSHADWGAAEPGFPVADANVAITRNISDLPWPLRENGMQFAALSEDIGAPLCPVFRANQQSTGLTIKVLSNTADTPRVNLVMHKVA